MTDQPPKATVSGSFRRAMGAVQEAVYRLTDVGARVLSPADPRVVDQFGDFLFVASDRVRTIKLVQSRHLAAIAMSDFVWLVAPDGYVGLSGAMEMGYAAFSGTPVFCSEVPIDLTLRQYVTIARTPEDAVTAIRADHAQRRAHAAGDVLLDPVGAVDAAHDDLERIALALTRGCGESGGVAAAADRLRRAVAVPLA